MANSALRTDVDERTKKEATAALEDIGITFSDALQLLLMVLAAKNSAPLQVISATSRTNATNSYCVCGLPSGQRKFKQ